MSGVGGVSRAGSGAEGGLVPRPHVPNRWQECGRKVQHLSRARAKDAARRLRAQHGVTTRVYRCRWCEGWHVGTMRASEVA